MHNYKIRVLDEEFFMVLSDEEYRGIAMLAAMSHGAIEIVNQEGGDEHEDTNSSPSA
mgnify:CR=1 FL=1